MVNCSLCKLRSTEKFLPLDYHILQNLIQRIRLKATLMEKQLQESCNRDRSTVTNNELFKSCDELGNNNRKLKRSRDTAVNPGERSHSNSASTTAFDGLSSSALPQKQGKIVGVPLADFEKKFHNPFYDICAFLLSPTPLVPGSFLVHHFSHEFSLTSDQWKKCKERGFLIHLRIWKTHCGPGKYYDAFPSKLNVVLNRVEVCLPPKPAPILLTNLDPTRKTLITGSWVSSRVVRSYEMGVFIEKALGIEEIVRNMKTLPTNVTDNIVKTFTNAKGNNNYHSTNAIVSVLCPLGQRRMLWPCRPVFCRHIQCFDAAEFLKIHLQNPFKIFNCPICKRPGRYIDFEILRRDTFFESVLRRLPPTATDQIRIFPDGSWMPVWKKKVETITISQ